MLVDRKAIPWVAGCVALLAGCGGWYLHFSAARPTGPSGGSLTGLFLGGLGGAMIAFCMLLCLRKAFRSMPLGATRQWMQAHVWFGLISYPIIWMHAGFRVGGVLTLTLMLLFTAVWLSGILGVLLQQRIPRRILETVPTATIHGQISTVIAALRDEADAVVRRAMQLLQAGDGLVPAGVATGPNDSATMLRSFYDTRVTPLLQDQVGFREQRGAAVQVREELATLRERVPLAAKESLLDLGQIIRQRVDLERQRRLHHFLHGWLLVHVPLSYAMFILGIVHAVLALRYATIG